MIGTPEEISADILMAALSTIITQALPTLTDDKMQLLQRGLATGKLRLVIDTPPLRIDVYTLDADGIDHYIFTVKDDRQKWSAWSRDLAQRSQ